MKFSILLPTYNGDKFLNEILNNILSQTYEDYELIICDDNSTDKSIQIIKSFNDSRIRLYTNNVNIGFPSNIRKCYELSKNEVILTMCQDDVIPNNLLQNYFKVYQKNPEVMAITRNYYLYNKKIYKPFRIWKFTKKNDLLFSHSKDNKPENFLPFIKTLDNMTALSFKRFDFNPFHEKHIWTSHAYPFIYALNRGKVVLFNRYLFAGTIHNNQSRLAKAYYNSPLKEWLIFCEEFKRLGMDNYTNYLRKNFISKNFIGLIQIKLFSNYKFLIYEILLLIKINYLNLFNLKFYIISLLTLLLPKKLISKISNFYKFKILPLSFKETDIYLYNEKL